MRVPIRVVFVLALLALGPFAFSATGPGGYGNEPYTWIRAGDYETEDNVLFDQASYDWTWGPSPVIGSAYALGDIRTGQAGLAQACSTLYYHDPYDIGNLSIGADVETWKPIVVTSRSLPVGTAAMISLTLAYEGTLQALESVEDKYCYASAEGGITLYDSLGNILAERYGEAEVECELIDGEREFMDETSGVWDDMLTPGVDINGDPIYTLLYQETVTFEAIVGQTYWVYFDLATSAHASRGSALGWDDSATFARADFANTGTYLLSSTDDVQFQMVPEPLSLTLLAAGAIALLRRRSLC